MNWRHKTPSWKLASEVSNAELAARNCKLEAGLEASNATSAELEAGLESSKAASAKLGEKNNKLEAGLEASNARSAELVARNDELKASVEASNATSAELVAQNAELVAQSAELKAGLEESSATGAELDAQNGKLAKLESEVGIVEAVNKLSYFEVSQKSVLFSSRRASATPNRCADPRGPCKTYIRDISIKILMYFSLQVKSLKKQLVELAPESENWVHSGKCRNN